MATHLSQQPIARRSTRLLPAVHELHKQGLQNLAIYTSMAPSGLHWRCQLIPLHHLAIKGDCVEIIVDNGSYEPAHHSSGDGGNLYFGWEDARSDSARTLAEKIKDRFPRLMEISAGSNYGYTGWFTEMLGFTERGALPVMWREHYSPEAGQITTTDDKARIPVPPIPHSWMFQGKRYSYKPGPHLKPDDDWHTAYQRIIDNWRSSEITLLPAYPLETNSLYEHGAYWEGAIYYIQHILGFSRIDDFLDALARPDPNSERWACLRWTWDNQGQFIYLKAFLVRHMLQDREKYPLDRKMGAGWEQWLCEFEANYAHEENSGLLLPNPYFGGSNPLHLGLKSKQEQDRLVFD